MRSSVPRKFCAPKLLHSAIISSGTQKILHNGSHACLYLSLNTLCKTEIARARISRLMHLNTSANQRFCTQTLQYLPCSHVNTAPAPATTRSHNFALAHYHASVTVVSKLKRLYNPMFHGLEISVLRDLPHPRFGVYEIVDSKASTISGPSDPTLSRGRAVVRRNS